ncbi:hypothetical protein BX600DRAFT_446258 [Xylariales sp. PMI_506]|nr:hypothetical protein BX600DRAFT_446258 [Xylariales sp. PMI_506]
MSLPRAIFPSLGLGNDICHVPRIYSILTSQRGHRFVARILTARELQVPRAKRILNCLAQGAEAEPVKRSGAAAERKDPNFWKAAEFIAGRFAAKEATIKAFHQRRLSFHDIEVLSREAEPSLGAGGPGEASESGWATHSSGPPVLVIQDQPETTACLSISHDGDYASAVCIYLPQASMPTNESQQ